MKTDARRKSKAGLPGQERVRSLHQEHRPRSPGKDGRLPWQGRCQTWIPRDTGQGRERRAACLGEKGACAKTAPSRCLRAQRPRSAFVLNVSDDIRASNLLAGAGSTDPELIEQDSPHGAVLVVPHAAGYEVDLVGGDGRKPDGEVGEPVVEPGPEGGGGWRVGGLHRGCARDLLVEGGVAEFAAVGGRESVAGNEGVAGELADEVARMGTSP